MEDIQMDEELNNLITLTDENGQEVVFEFVDLIPYDNEEYVVLLPTDDDDSEVVILRVEPGDDENDSFVSVEDYETLNAVYEIFKEKFKDIFTFES